MIKAHVLERHLIPINIVLTAVMAIMAAKLFVVIFKESIESLAKIDRPIAVEVHVEKKVSPYERYSIIETRNLFSAKIADLGQNTGRSPKTIPTSLQLKLLGTIAGEVGYSYAIIESIKEKKQGLYVVGDTILDAEIKAIERNKVTLKRGKKEEVLYAYVKSEERKPLKKEPGEVSDSVEAINAIEEIGINKWRISKSLTISKVGTINNVLNGLRLKPNIAGGKIKGLVVDSIASGNILSDMGMQNGDILEGINGKGITNLKSTFEIIKGLKASKKVEVAVRRSGKRVILEYDLVD